MRLVDEGQSGLQSVSKQRVITVRLVDEGQSGLQSVSAMYCVWE